MDIKTIGLTKIYARKGLQEVAAVRDINLHVFSGEKIALTGPSGSGKSTLIHLLGLMDRATSGQIFIDDKQVDFSDDNFSCRMRRDCIGFVFQFHYLLADFTVLENTLMPVYNKRQNFLQKALDILDRLGLLERRNNFPNELSGGQQQRAALARALINSPKIIFADEPTGNLDTVTGNAIEKLLFEACAQNNTTLFLVTHNEALANKADRILKMEDGGIR
ncbi:MAG: ABC transporter ATP-binding protein [Elusimicrobiota bacterium]|jgi:lipoprotein-releasing system ATP-binding protein|nr:ABC transporter ATP-binding protein [Elusimicrobiota bacterium]